MPLSATSPARPPVLCFSTVDWDYLWHRPQVVMSRLAEDGFPVLYVDTLGLRSPCLRDWRRILSRLRRGVGGSGATTPARRSKQGQQPPTDLQVYSPLLLPFLDSRLARRANLLALVPALRRRLVRLSPHPPVIWVYLPTWTVLQCVRRLPHRALVCEAIDALGSNPAGVSRDFHAAERLLVQQADLVLTTSESLHAERATLNPNTHWVPSGVGAAFFTPAGVAAEVAAIPGPRLGFFGTLDHRLDLSLLAELAGERPDWSWVLIGPQRADLGPLLCHANVHWLGPRPHRELPACLAALDVLVLPYVLDEFTRHVYPAKIYECLALGKPVVATALPSLGPLAEVVRLVESRAGFAAALTAALAEDDPELRTRRVAVARQNSWESRYQQIRTQLDRVLGQGPH